jgi:hypothetical protein
MGKKTSGTNYSSVPEKPLGATPRMVKSSPLNFTVRPMVEGLPAKRFCQQAQSDDGDRMAAGVDIVLGLKDAPAGSGDSQNIEIVPGDKVAPGAPVVACETEAGGEETISNHPGKDGVAVADIAVVEVGERGEGVAGEGFVDRHYFAGVRDGNGA